MSNKWNDADISKLLELRQQGLTWEQLTKEFPSHSANALRKAYYRYEGLETSSDPVVESLKAAERAKKQKSLVVKENKHVLTYLEKRQDLLSEIRDLVGNVKFTKSVVVKPKIDRKKRNMTMELMLTDLHYGKKSKTFNSEVAKKRMKKFGEVVLSEHDRYSKLYNVEKIIAFLGGDIIENSDFHGVESRRASEFGNPEQVVLAVKSLFEDLITAVS